jgi:hypothetical protein
LAKQSSWARLVWTAKQIVASQIARIAGTLGVTRVSIRPSVEDVLE